MNHPTRQSRSSIWFGLVGGTLIFLMVGNDTWIMFVIVVFIFFIGLIRVGERYDTLLHELQFPEHIIYIFFCLGVGFVSYSGDGLLGH